MINKNKLKNYFFCVIINTFIQTKMETSKFGQVDGPTIINKETILEEIDTAINRKPPSIEYIVCLPFAYYKLPLLGIGINLNMYGHSVLRYRLPKDDGTYEDIVMNIEGKREPNLNKMVHFYPTQDYLFSVDAEQGGIYNRSMLSVAYHNVPDEKIKKMHQYFQELDQKSLTGHKKFDIVFGPIWNQLGCIFPTIVERGNCAKWTSEGLKRAGVVNHVHIWPKNLWISLFEKCKEEEKPSVIYYERVHKIPRKYGKDVEIGFYTAPLDWARSFTYRNPKQFADGIVRVPLGQYHAVIEVNPNPIKPNKIRDSINSPFFIVTSTLLCGYVTYKTGRRGFQQFRRILYGPNRNRTQNK
jgi:hypothetical protein